MEDSSISVYGEAKGEYTKQLCVFLVIPLQKFFLGLLTIAKQEEPDKRKHLMKFQDLLKQVPDWNVDKVGRETAKIQEDSGCDYLEELLTAVFIAHTKVLSAIRLSSKNKSIQITVPKLEHFLHRTITESARRIWGMVYLFADNISSLERQKNLRQLESILTECIQQAVRGLLPVKNLLRDYLAEPDSTEVEETPTEQENHEHASSEKKTPNQEETQPVEEKKEEVPTIEEQPTLVPEVIEEETTPPIIVVDTEPRVHFSKFNTVFNPSDPEKPEIVKHNDEDEEENDEYDTLRIYDETQHLSASDFESLDKPDENLPIEFEQL